MLFAKRALWAEEWQSLYLAGTLQNQMNKKNQFLFLHLLSVGMRQHEFSKWKGGVIQALLAFCCAIFSSERGVDRFLYIIWQFQAEIEFSGPHLSEL